jgi:hypothetical protein
VLLQLAGGWLRRTAGRVLPWLVGRSRGTVCAVLLVALAMVLVMVLAECSTMYLRETEL